MPSHILIAHDLRDTADMALCAAQLAKQFNAKLTILHVLDPSKSSQGMSLPNRLWIAASPSTPRPAANC